MDQLAEYRARQQQRFEAEQAKLLQHEQQQQQHTANDVEQGDVTNAGRQDPVCTGAARARPPALTQLKEIESSAAASCCSCPGTPRDYRARHQQRFTAEKVIRQQEPDDACSLNAEDTSQSSMPEVRISSDESPALIQTDNIERGIASSSDSSPPTPRLRGSASLRAISAARAMRQANSPPLPGAAWPGHCSQTASSSSSLQAAGRKPPALPPRPPTPSSISSPALRRSCGRGALLPLAHRPPIPSSSSSSSQGYLQRSWSASSCAQAMASHPDGTASLGLLCH